MSELTIYLTDGFDGDRVVVRLDGKIVFERSGVTTKKITGLAEQLPTVEVRRSPAKIEVSVPDRKVTGAFEADMKRGSHVTVGLEGRKLAFFQHERVGFM